MAKFTPDMLQAHKALVAAVEPDRTWQAKNTGFTWGDVYLDNAKPNEWNGRKWAGVLAALEKAGSYIRYDDPDFAGIWGKVRMGL